MSKNNLCECFDNNFENCPFPDAIQTFKVAGFNDEPLTERKECSYQLWIGASAVAVSNFTRAGWGNIQKEEHALYL
jgi:hypothetical protein